MLLKSHCLRPSFINRAANHFYFSLSEEALKAIWAKTIIKKIALDDYGDGSAVK